MKNRKQLRWAIVSYSGIVHTGFVAYSRKVVIEKVLAESRQYSMPAYNGTGLTDRQFWRQIKKRRGYAVKRISIRVMR
jgi:hypothetical protein